VCHRELRPRERAAAVDPVFRQEIVEQGAHADEVAAQDDWFTVGHLADALVEQRLRVTLGDAAGRPI